MPCWVSARSRRRGTHGQWVPQPSLGIRPRTGGGLRGRGASAGRRRRIDIAYPGRATYGAPRVSGRLTRKSGAREFQACRAFGSPGRVLLGREEAGLLARRFGGLASACCDRGSGLACRGNYSSFCAFCWRSSFAPPATHWLNGVPFIPSGASERRLLSALMRTTACRTSATSGSSCPQTRHDPGAAVLSGVV